MAEKKFLSVREASERLDLPEKKVRNMIRAGKLPVVKVGYNMIIAERDVERLAAQQEEK